jgi:hypothetical protein
MKSRLPDSADPFVAGWVGALLSALEEEVAPEVRARVLARCAGGCTAGWASVAAEVRESSGSADVDSLLARFAGRLPGGADLSRRGDVIEWRFAGAACPCPVARAAPHSSLCECSVAHVRGMLEPLLGRTLDVRLLRSRLRGADDCLFAVRL